MSRERYTLEIPGCPPGKGDWLEVTSPYSGETVGEVELGGEEALEQALALQRRLFRDRSTWLPTHERVGILRRAAELMRGCAEELALRIAREGGKPLSDARVEVARAIDGVEYLAGEAGRHAGREIPMGATPASVGRLAFTTYEPIGVVVAVSAFNHPLNLIVHQAGPAVAAGCPVIIKPASTTPLSCHAFVRILHEAGLPPAWCLALPARTEIAKRLVTSPEIAFFSFIGSAEVGWTLRGELSPGVRCALEHGGAAPLIVDASADLDTAVPLILKGGYYHAGQVCVSVQRVFAHESCKGELVERLEAGVRALRTGDPTLSETEVGPLIVPSEVTRVHEWVQKALQQGAKLACGGEILGQQCYAPTLLVDAPDNSRVMRSEVFGPVVNVAAFEDLDAAVERCNEGPWAFQAAVLGRDLERALRAARGLDASAVMINDHTAFRVDWMPFAGRRHSGLGIGGMPYTLEDLTQHKLIVFRS
ncbi:MAG: aldehyde dehydrogenase family protein [Myxococcota bacterium]